MPTYHLGIDDTDSLKMGCTTYVGALIIEKLIHEATFVDFPNLIRLNPNIPWKSRGNAAICLRISTSMNYENLLAIATEIVEGNRDRYDEKNQPGIALLEGQVPDELKFFGRRALYDVLSIYDAVKLAHNLGIKYKTIKGGRGLIGALAAIGNTLESDHTFELIVYRKKETWGKPRSVDYDSVAIMDKKTSPYTFNNIDYETNRILITPRGPDPILFGIRGESPKILQDALRRLIFSGGERWVIYRSNQGTDAHLINHTNVSSLGPYQSVVIAGKIISTPKIIRGGHVIARLSDGTGEVDVAAYEKSGEIQMVLRRLLPGDFVRAYGGVSVHEGDDKKITLNLEKLEVLELAKARLRNPLCNKCKVRMKTKGKSKGFKCEKCGQEAKEPSFERLNRTAKEGIYLPPPRSVRHLTKPLQRYGMEKKSWDGSVDSFFGFIDSKRQP